MTLVMTDILYIEPFFPLCVVLK